MYNMTTLTNADTIFGLVNYANDSSETLLMGLFLIAIFIILMFMFLKWNFENSVLTASYVCFTLSVFLVYIDFLNFYYSLFFLVTMSFAALYNYVVNR